MSARTLKGFLTLAVASLLPACSCSYETNSNIFQRMQVQQKYEAYEASEFYEDGRAMRHPPEGTVPRERLSEIGPLRNARGSDGEYLERVPVRVNAKLLARGQERFEIYCAVCHGVVGDGSSPVADNMSLRAPPSLVDDIVTARSDGFLFEAITEGYGLMPSYANELTLEDRWAVVVYLRALQRSQNATVADLPAPVRQKLMGAVR